MLAAGTAGATERITGAGRSIDVLPMGIATRSTSGCRSAEGKLSGTLIGTAVRPAAGLSPFRLARTSATGSRRDGVVPGRVGLTTEDRYSDVLFRGADPLSDDDPSRASARATARPPVTAAAPTPSATAKLPTRPTQALARMISKC